MTAPTTSTAVLTCVSGWKITTSCAIRYVLVLYFLLLPLCHESTLLMSPTPPMLDTLCRSSIDSAGKLHLKHLTKEQNLPFLQRCGDKFINSATAFTAAKSAAAGL